MKIKQGTKEIITQSDCYNKDLKLSLINGSENSEYILFDSFNNSQILTPQIDPKITYN